MDSAANNAYYKEEAELFDAILEVTGSHVVWKKEKGVQLVGMSKINGLQATKGLFIQVFWNALVAQGWTPGKLDATIIFRDRNADFCKRRLSNSPSRLSKTEEESVEKSKGTESDVCDSTDYSEDEEDENNLESAIDKSLKFERLKRYQEQISKKETDLKLPSRVLMNSLNLIVEVLGKRFRGRIPKFDGNNKLFKTGTISSFNLMGFLSPIDQELLVLSFRLNGANVTGSYRAILDTIPLNLSKVERLESGFRLKMSATTLRSVFKLEDVVSIHWLHKNSVKMKERILRFTGEHCRYEGEAVARATQIAFDAMIRGELETSELIQNLEIVGIAFYAGLFTIAVADDGVTIETGEFGVVRKTHLGWKQVA